MIGRSNLLPVNRDRSGAVLLTYMKKRLKCYIGVIRKRKHALYFTILA